MDRLSRVQNDLDDATASMRDNIELVVDRGEHLAALIDKSDSLANNARSFQNSSTSLKRSMWLANMQTMLCAAAGALTFLLLVFWHKTRTHA